MANIEHQTQTAHEGHEQHQGGGSSMGALAMIAMCVGIILLLVLLSAVGLPYGLLIALGAAVLMIALHSRFMGHGS